MNIHIILSVAASTVFALSLAWYVRDVAKGRVRVAIATIAMLALINLSQLGALMAKQLWYVVPFTAVAFVMNMLIIIFGIRNGKFQLKPLDIAVCIGAFLGLIAWYTTGDAAMNIYILTVVMLLSIIPIVTKTFRDPSSETKLPWLLNFGAAILFLGTIQSPEPAAWLVQARQFVFAVLMVVGVHFPVVKIKKVK